MTGLSILKIDHQGGMLLSLFCKHLVFLPLLFHLEEFNVRHLSGTVGFRERIGSKKKLAYQLGCMEILSEGIVSKL